MKSVVFSLFLFALFAFAIAEFNMGDPNSIMNEVMPFKQLTHDLCRESGECPSNLGSHVEGKIECINGMAGNFNCSNIDLYSMLSAEDCGSRNQDASDIWGWIDSETGDMWAIVNFADGTSFVNVTDPMNPTVYGFLNSTHNGIEIWHDIKMYKNHAFIGSEVFDHGMQIVDMEQFKVEGVEFSKDYIPEFTFYDQFGSSHNIVINEETGFLYAVGTRTCSAGLHVVNIQDPKNPTFAGCYSEDGYTHDAQCVIYHGPDQRYTGNEICFNYNEDTLTIVNVTDKDNMVLISRTGYEGSAYVHQGWLTKDHVWAISNDELDEVQGTNPGGKHTRSLFWDCTNLEAPKLAENFFSTRKSIDHNLYVVTIEGENEDDSKEYVVESNYTAGLRILDITNLQSDGTVEEVAYFETSPKFADRVSFLGTWSNYPYYGTDLIAVNVIESGLFLLSFDFENFSN
eukprot:TRINITY_DN270_c0_g1_i1.p1 TRINITY_DN270_c0_g1~~TRINITY_DN270_c0_g1_i1.p1  ORF type:complete len:464 (-),score=161.09 TRINITY_DN270_c0_g1_i1:177-1544(-)